jgi:hypothetical protein
VENKLFVQCLCGRVHIPSNLSIPWPALRLGQIDPS